MTYPAGEPSSSPSGRPPGAEYIALNQTAHRDDSKSASEIDTDEGYIFHQNRKTLAHNLMIRNENVI
ncbi:hypothetical protein [Aeromonas bivalvium]|uniref:hypothetical protein n=1 Tax=Aeromonas bivalvium TaxID=440079 RepID=UPI003D263290